MSIVAYFGLNLHFIIYTDVHAVHITSASILKNKYAAQIAHGSLSQVESVDLLLEDGQEINVGNINLKTIHTPGHTKGCVSLYSPEGYVFTGDTLFIKGAGRTDFQGGSTQSSYDSIKQKLYTLPNETIVYPAHDYKGLTSSTIGQEKQWNDSVNETTQLEDYIKREEQKDRPYPKKFDSAVPANSYCGDQSKIIS